MTRRWRSFWDDLRDAAWIGAIFALVVYSVWSSYVVPR